MPGRFTRWATRAALPGTGAGLGMVINKPTAPQRDAPSVATLQTGSGQEGVYQTPDWSGRNAIEQGYYGSVWVMRSLQAIADTAAALPFRAGLDPDTPDQWNPNAPLTRLLGPASPQAPGGPNPVLTARAFWAWSVVQKLATGKMAWELQSDPGVRNWNATGNQIVGLWPLVAYLVDPIPVFGQARYFSGYTYHGTDGDRNLTDQQVFYAWRMSQKDPRQPESLLQGCTLSVSIDVAINRYMWNLLNNGLVATHVVQSLPIDEPEMRRSWEEQFMARFTGFDNSGRVIFDYAENNDGGVKDTLQITPVATKPVDAQLLEIAAKAKTEVLVGLGVPESLIGNASQRIYANSDAEYRSFWTLRMLDIITELQDDVNTYLAPKLGPEVGWFDLSRVSALRPPSAFQPPALTDLLTAGVIGPQDVNNLLGLANDPDIDTSTVNLGELDSAQSPAGTTARDEALRYADALANPLTRSLPFAHWEEGIVNTHTLRNGTAWRPVLDLPARSNVVTTQPAVPVRSERAEAIVARVREVAERRSAKTAELAGVRYDPTPLATSVDAWFDTNARWLEVVASNGNK